MASSARPLRVGYVPEHFSTPLHFAKRHYGLDAELVAFPSGTGHMISALRGGEIDAAIGLTEGWIAHLGNGQQQQLESEVEDDGGFRLVGTYVETPLCWAILTGANRPEIATVDSLQRSRIGVSRIGSGSYVMGYVLADERGWLVPSAGLGGAAGAEGGKQEQKQEQKQASPYSDVVVLHTFDKLRAAVNSGEADFFMWEHFTSKRYFDAGEIRRVGEIYTPWSSWKIVASTRLAPGPGQPVDARVEDLLDRLNLGIRHFREHQDEAVRFISTELDYTEEDAREWLKTVRFPDRTHGVDPGVVARTIDVLRKAGVLEAGKAVDGDAMIAKRR